MKTYEERLYDAIPSVILLSMLAGLNTTEDGRRLRGGCSQKTVRQAFIENLNQSRYRHPVRLKLSCRQRALIQN